ncbi:hypothetical protein M3Y97_00511200 [Aphelenchoides bicaudatus]|nr:hypothetical protein M3Y97_00511200 [Aphelenchoides bicaudatus]
MGETTEYGCNVTNKFNFLDESEDVDVLLAKAQKEKKEKAKQAKLAAKKSAEAPAPVVPVKTAREPREPREPRPVQNCFNCDQPGHLSRDCTQERKPRPPREPREPRPQKERPPQTCFNCQGVGHISRDCPEPRQNAGDENTAPKADKKPKVNGDVQQDENTEEQQTEEPVETGPPKLSLAEWKAQHQHEKATFNTRQVDHSKDKTLSKFEPIKREDEKPEDEFEEVEMLSKRAQKTQVLNIDLSFSNKGGFGRREGGNNDRRGGQRNGNRPAVAGSSGRQVNTRRLNQNEFPAL